MQRNLLLRVAGSALALAALSPLARADEKGDAILRKVEFRAESFNSYFATISYDEPANHRVPSTVQVWFRKAPLLIRISPLDPEDRRFLIKSAGSLFVGPTKRGSKPYSEFLWIFPMFSGKIVEFVGEVVSTRWISAEPDDNGKATLEVVEVTGKKRKALFWVDGTGVIRKISAFTPGGAIDTVTLQRLSLDASFPDSVFTPSTQAKGRRGMAELKRYISNYGKVY